MKRKSRRQSPTSPAPNFVGAPNGVGAPDRAAMLRLFFLGFLTLFLELVFIRFLAGNIWNLGYFPNLVLLAAFVGLGAGFLFHDRLDESASRRVFALVPIFIAFFVAVIYGLSPGIPGFDDTSLGAEFDGEAFWTAFSVQKKRGDNEEWMLFAFWFGFIAFIFAVISQRTAKVFARFKPLTSYSLDIAGSAAGVASFIVISFLEISAAWWFVLLIPLFVAATEYDGKFFSQGSRWLFAPISLLLLAAVIVRDFDVNGVNARGEFINYWSPYQRITHNSSDGGIYANNINHQGMHGEETMRKSIYFLLHDARKKAGTPPFKSALIIGAGSGNDVAAAIISGVENIHAVEIDPVIQRIGAEHHPLDPYSQPQVSVTIDDGRHVLAVADKKYDLIILALTDSVVKASPVSQLRLENYLFTKESFEKAWSLLEDGGALMLYNFYRYDWIINKLRAALAAATGLPPRVMFYQKEGGIAVLAAIKSPAEKQAEESIPQVEIPVDDWPFLYLKERGIPDHYITAMILIAVFVGAMLAFASTTIPTAAKSRGGNSRYRLAFVLMGAAFLLLETKGIIQFSLLFGTTWLNSSLVFLGVLLLVLAANWTAVIIRSPKLIPAAFALVFVACAAVLAYPLGNLLQVEWAAARFVFAILLIFLPIFFANLVFSVIFRHRAEPEKFFGWNLLGGTLGGAAEYLSLATGYHALAWAVLICYAGVFLCVLPEVKAGLNSAEMRAQPQGCG